MAERRRRAAVVLTAAGLALGAAPVARASPTACPSPPLVQAFAAWGDHAWYWLVPGQGPDGFTGSGWTLRGGARIVPAPLSDGRRGTVLDLPAGSSAVSPPVCLDSSDTTRRAMVAAPGRSWTPSRPELLLTGAPQLRQLTVRGPARGESRMYGLYVDPYRKG